VFSPPQPYNITLKNLNKTNLWKVYYTLIPRQQLESKKIQESKKSILKLAKKYSTQSFRFSFKDYNQMEKERKPRR
jgi:hypothetical protein